MERYGMPAAPLAQAIGLRGVLETRPLGLAQSTTKKLCLCNLQRQKDAERQAKARKGR